jgi:hypothetical protein
MKISMFILLIFTCLTLAAQPNITKIDVPYMTNKLLPGFELKTSSVHWVFGRRYIFENNDKDYINLSAGLYSTNIKAHKIAQEYLSNISMRIIEDTLNTDQIGEKLWVYKGNNGVTTNIVLIRHNALIIISSHKFNDSLLSLAKSIDNLLVKRGDIINDANSIVVPIVCPSVSFEADKKKAIVSFNVVIESDTLDYSFSPGITKRDGMYVINNVEKFKHKLDRHNTIKVVGVNQYNQVSEITEFILK